MINMLDVCYRSCIKASAVTCLSTYKTEVKADESVYDPNQVFLIGKRLSERVLLDHSYAPHDFLLCLWKPKSKFRLEWEASNGWDEGGKSQNE